MVLSLNASLVDPGLLLESPPHTHRKVCLYMPVSLNPLYLPTRLCFDMFVSQPAGLSLPVCLSVSLNLL